MHQLVGLICYGVRECLEIVAEAVDADTRGQINIGLAVHIPECCALSLFKGHLETPVGLHEILGFRLFEFLKAHSIIPFRSVPLFRSRPRDLRTPADF